MNFRKKQQKKICWKTNLLFTFQIQGDLEPNTYDIINYDVFSESSTQSEENQKITSLQYKQNRAENRFDCFFFEVG